MDELGPGLPIVLIGFMIVTVISILAVTLIGIVKGDRHG